MARSTIIKLSAVSFLVLTSAVGIGCVAGGAGEGPASEVEQESPAAESAPAAAPVESDGLRAGKALLAAFPGFDRERPVAIEIEDEESGANDADLVEATPETRETVGIDHWALRSDGVDGFIGGVRVLAFRDKVDKAEDDEGSPPREVSLWWAFQGESGSHSVGGPVSAPSLDEKGQAVLAVVANDLQKIQGGSTAFSFKCLGAKAGLVLAIATADTSCAASIAELGANPAADVVCLGALVAVGNAVKSVYNACGIVPSVAKKPVGPYLFHCSNIKMDYINNKLTATCKNSAGASVTSTLNDPLHCYKLIRDCNGKLACTLKCP
jgi:hypothetical protein